MVRKSTHLQVIPQQSTEKGRKFATTDVREKPVDFFCCATWALTLSPAIILSTQAPLQKFPFMLVWNSLLSDCLILELCRQYDF